MSADHPRHPAGRHHPQGQRGAQDALLGGGPGLGRTVRRPAHHLHGGCPSLLRMALAVLAKGSSRAQRRVCCGSLWTVGWCTGSRFAHHCDLPTCYLQPFCAFFSPSVPHTTLPLHSIADCGLGVRAAVQAAHAHGQGHGCGQCGAEGHAIEPRAACLLLFGQGHGRGGCLLAQVTARHPRERGHRCTHSTSCAPTLSLPLLLRMRTAALLPLRCTVALLPSRLLPPAAVAL